jgi:hypothetical protein
MSNTEFVVFIIAAIIFTVSYGAIIYLCFTSGSPIHGFSMICLATGFVVTKIANSVVNR